MGQIRNIQRDLRAFADTLEPAAFAEDEDEAYAENARRDRLAAEIRDELDAGGPWQGRRDPADC